MERSCVLSFTETLSSRLGKNYTLASLSLHCLNNNSGFSYSCSFSLFCPPERIYNIPHEQPPQKMEPMFFTLEFQQLLIFFLSYYSNIIPVLIFNDFSNFTVKLTKADFSVLSYMYLSLLFITKF